MGCWVTTLCQSTLKRTGICGPFTILWEGQNSCGHDQTIALRVGVVLERTVGWHPAITQEEWNRCLSAQACNCWQSQGHKGQGCSQFPGISPQEDCSDAHSKSLQSLAHTKMKNVCPKGLLKREGQRSLSSGPEIWA